MPQLGHLSLAKGKRMSAPAGNFFARTTLQPGHFRRPSAAKPRHMHTSAAAAPIDTPYSPSEAPPKAINPPAAIENKISNACVLSDMFCLAYGCVCRASYWAAASLPGYPLADTGERLQLAGSARRPTLPDLVIVDQSSPSGAPVRIPTIDEGHRLSFLVLGSLVKLHDVAYHGHRRTSGFQARGINVRDELCSTWR